MTTQADIPTLPAYRTRDGIQLMVWCTHCQKWHCHGGCGGTCNPRIRDRYRFLPAGTSCACPVGTGNGHRVAHCHCDCSPYNRTGYTLVETGGRFEDQPQPPKVNIEKAARAMPKAERRTYLQEHGWHQLSNRDAETWFAPGWVRTPQGYVDPPDHDSGFYTLAAAIRKALSQEAGVHP
jgi:hypothetical protein